MSRFICRISRAASQLSLLAAFFCAATTLSAETPAPTAAPPSEADLIREELRQIKLDYDQRMHALEERLQRLDAANAPKPAAAPATPVVAATAPAAPPPAPPAPAPTAAPEKTVAPAVVTPPAGRVAEIKARVDQEFQGDTETRDIALLRGDHPYKERVEEILNQFVDIKGYLRGGFGRNSEGGPQTGFGAPGAMAKYRLGNEAETYGELTIGKNFYPSGFFKLDAANPDAALSGPIAHVQTTISVFNPYTDALNSGATDFGLPELWGSIGNVIPSQPTVKFWAGNRFYRRHDIHVNDFFFSNMSGGGGGVEDIPLAGGKFALAWVGAGSTSGVSSAPVPDAANKAGFAKGNLDLRLYDVPMPGGKGEFGLVYAHTSSGQDATGHSAPSADGFSVMFIHTSNGIISEDGMNKASLQFGTGAAKTLNSGFETFTQNGSTFIRPDAKDSWRFRFTEQLIANVSDSFSIGPAFVYQYTDYATGHEKVQWVSAGVRPIWHFNNRVSLAGEAGVDWVKNDAAHTNGALYKFTLAPQVSLGGRFMSRPVIRAYFTYATWADDFVGSVGGLDYANESEGFTYGVQMETWW